MWESIAPYPSCVGTPHSVSSMESYVSSQSIRIFRFLSLRFPIMLLHLFSKRFLVCFIKNVFLACPLWTLNSIYLTFFRNRNFMCVYHGCVILGNLFYILCHCFLTFILDMRILCRHRIIESNVESDGYVCNLQCWFILYVSIKWLVRHHNKCVSLFKL